MAPALADLLNSGPPHVSPRAPAQPLPQHGNRQLPPLVQPAPLRVARIKTPPSPKFPTTPVAVFRLPLPSAESDAQSYQQPSLLGRFSYGPTRDLLLGDARDDSIQEMEATLATPFDLNTGFENAVWRNEEVDEGLDSLLDCLIDIHQSYPPSQQPAFDRRIACTRIITWRGILTKLCAALYETANSDQWTLNAMFFDGTLYLEDGGAHKAPPSPTHLRQTYRGYSFESYATKKWGQDHELEQVNNNIQWCAVVKSSIGKLRIIMGGEVDCVRPGALTPGHTLETGDFVELKTKLALTTEKDKRNFERYSLLKFYIQSFLLGTPLVRVGFRTREGILTGWNDFKTSEIPMLVKQSHKKPTWSASKCLNTAHDILDFIIKALSPEQQARVRDYEDRYHAMAKNRQSYSQAHWDAWPIFRLTFVPPVEGQGRATGSIEIHELPYDSGLVQQVRAYKTPGERVGFLPSRWVAFRFHALRQRLADPSS